MAHPELLILVEETARFLGGIHPKTLQRMARRREVPAYRFGRSWFFRRSDLDPAAALRGNLLTSQSARGMSERTSCFRGFVIKMEASQGKAPGRPECLGLPLGSGMTFVFETRAQVTLSPGPAAVPGSGTHQIQSTYAASGPNTASSSGCSPYRAHRNLPQLLSSTRPAR
ncbi:MAG: helix-turn-helix domain-containing protein [Acidobacteriaceae bacterium]